MAKVELQWILFTAFLLPSCNFLLFAALPLPPCHFPAIYNFGDSNSDTGGISAAFEPTKPPYGEIFKKPVGRASDGRLIIDFIAERLNIPHLSAYLDSIGANYRHGANFATGGSTIGKPNETIYEYGISPFFLGMQIIQFDQFKSRTSNLLKSVKNTADEQKLPRSEDYSRALYTFDIGQNDLSVGFRKMSTEQLRDSIPSTVNQLADAIQHIYKEAGGRSFWIHGTGPFGCLPTNLFYVSNPPVGFLDEVGCVVAQNAMAMEFNAKLKDRIVRLRNQLPLATITYVDVYGPKYEIIKNAAKEGFVDPLKACCGYHVNFTHIWCGKRMKIGGKEIYGGVCKNPWAAVSWDGVHYSEAANRWVANRTQNGMWTDPPTPIAQACCQNTELITETADSPV